MLGRRRTGTNLPARKKAATATEATDRKLRMVNRARRYREKAT